MTAGSDGMRPAALPADAVLLHIGVHKTGTTALQTAFADARNDLRALGVRYPGKRSAHHAAALAMLQKPWGWKGRGGEVRSERNFDKLVEQVAEHGGRVVVSSEHFCEADDATAERVVQGLGADRVQVVVTLRNLGHLLPSSWQQYLKYGVAAPYDTWLENTFDPHSERTISPSFWKRNDHGALIERWVATVGADRVHIVVLEGVDRGAIFRTFAQFIDVPEDLLVSRMDLTSNRSMTAQESEFLRRINQEVRRSMSWDEYERLVRKGVARTLVEGREPGPEEPRVHTPDWALDAAAARGADAVERIRATGATVIGDLDRLAVRVPSTPPVPPGVLQSMPLEAAVRSMSSLILLSQQEPSTKDLAADLARRLRRDVRRKGKRSRA